MPHLVRKAFYIAKGRPGPVLVDVTAENKHRKMEFEPFQPKAIEPKTETYTVEDLDCQIEIRLKKVKNHLSAGGRHFIWCQESQSDSLKIDAPASETLMQRFDTRPLQGMLGMHGTRQLG